MSTVPKKVSRRSLLCNCCNNDDACAQNVNQFGERQSVWCHQGTRTENWNLVPLSHNFLLPFLRCRTIIPTYFKAIFRPSRPTEQTNRPDGDLTWYTCQTNKMELGHPAQRCRKLKIQMFPIEQAVPPILFSRWFRIYINLHKVFKYGYFAAKWNPHHCVCRIINSVFQENNSWATWNLWISWPTRRYQMSAEGTSNPTQNQRQFTFLLQRWPQGPNVRECAGVALSDL